MEYSIERRPSFLTWLKITWLDILTLLIIGAVGFVVAQLPPVLPRTFPLTVTATDEVIYPEFAYPYREQVIASWLDALLATALPIAVILIANLLRIRSFWDVNNAVFGLLNGHVYATTCHVFLKWTVGGLRPYFYDVCRPDPERVAAAVTTAAGAAGIAVNGNVFGKEDGHDAGHVGKPTSDKFERAADISGGTSAGTGYRHYMFTSSVCAAAPPSHLANPSYFFRALPTTTHNADATDPSSSAVLLRNALESFPSGHTTTMFCGMVYLTLYLNAKLKIFSDRMPRSWEIGALTLPILFAACVAGLLTVDRSHHWYDVLAGAALGTLFAIVGFRSAYAGVGDWKKNHIPLNKGGPEQGRRGGEDDEVEEGVQQERTQTGMGIVDRLDETMFMRSDGLGGR